MKILIPILVAFFICAVGLYFIWRGERNEKKGKVVSMKTDVDISESFYTEEII